MKATRLALALAALLAPSLAQADVISMWVSGKGSYVNGTGETFKRFQGSPTAGAEVGIHFLFLDLWADVVAMQDDQMLITANLGPSATFGDRLKLNLGVYGSAMFFLFPEDENPSDGLTFTPDQRQAIDAAGYGDQVTTIQQEYRRIAAAESDIGRTAAGFAARGRAALEFYFIPVLALGVEGMAGYHFIISGDDAAAGAKNEAIDQLASEQMLPSEVADVVREAAGAKPVDTEDLNGLHYQAGLYLKLKFGL